MCKIITLIYKETVKEFESKKECNCCLGSGKDSSSIDREFAEWVLMSYQEISDKYKIYSPEVTITIF